MRKWLGVFIGPAPRLVNAVFLDKLLSANWALPWHQDFQVPVQKGKGRRGFAPVSEEDSISHIRPPAAFLEQMLILRLHIDACNEDNGALHVLPGTHVLGHLSDTEINQLVTSTEHMVCVAAPGDALAMRPLLLHASPRSRSPSSRRIVHLEFTSQDLPPPLRWRESMLIGG
jgi:ectoine hydroxylase-related dioxygenase (phytanoyl-CoA dioxygenase family)